MKKMLFAQHYKQVHHPFQWQPINQSTNQDIFKVA